MRRLLTISWALPPILKPRSLQVARILKALAGLGWEIDVVTVNPRSSITAKPLDNQLEAYYDSVYRVHRANESFSQPLSIALGTLVSSLRPLPDAERGWRRSASSLAHSLLSKTSYDILLSFGQPWSSHIAALELAATSKLPWVAHFSDPWADNPYYAVLRSGQRASMFAWEQQVIEKADHIIFTNRQTSRRVMQKYPSGWLKKISVTPHSYDASLMPQQGVARTSKHLNLVYTGDLYGLRSPEAMIRALAKVRDNDKLRIKIAGSVRNKRNHEKLADELGVSRLIEFVGQLNYQDSLRLAAAADVLLLIDAPSPKENLFLPSKLIDYLMFNKPILGITPLQGASAELLRRLGSPVVAPNDVLGIAAELEKFLGLWLKGALALPAQASEVSRAYSSEIVALDFDKILRSLLPGSRRLTTEAY